MHKVGTKFTEGYKYKTGVRQKSIFIDFTYGDMVFEFPNIDVHSKTVNVRMNKFKEMYKIFHSMINKQTPSLDFSK